MSEEPACGGADAVERHKRLAAEEAATLVRPGMRVGLGHGSTACHAVEVLAGRYERGELPGLTCAVASAETASQARGLGLPVRSLAQMGGLDLTIDGADEVDPALNLVKGGGGALLREKVLAQMSERLVIVCHRQKLVERLGSSFDLPVEVLPFALAPVRGHIRRDLGLESRLRRDERGIPALTEQGNMLLDLACGPIDDPRALHRALKEMAGLVEHGLFLGLATDVLAAGEDGVEHMQPS
ncbi:ribose-5-phosphate isomerase RpiA [Desulfohalovibrio reitneri]|uniref:ribose-5-phosphate isomerase RpiA n=1 Tax=Desulfohalovibrio reitneri TaxID=1307759 RepID=UPI0004A6F231|nr:ribose-5-phosphate isomerase RpiA [Desulfohalovibrio reitneri]